MYIGRQKDLWLSLIGSHMWHMESKESDSDYYRVYQVPTASILYGEPYKATESERERKYISLSSGNPVQCDEVAVEIGYHVNKIIEGDIIAIWGTVSPLPVVDASETRTQLATMIKTGMSKNIIPSLKEFANMHYSKGEELERSDPKAAAKRYKIALRTLNFGVNWLYGDISFNRVEIAKKEDVEERFKVLEYAMSDSHLKDRTDEIDFRKWLFRLRMRDLNKEILSRFE